MRLVQVIFNRVGVVWKLICQVFVNRLSLGYSFNKAWDNVVTFVLPRIFFAPVVIKVALYDFHLLVGSLLCIGLHFRVERSIYF